MWQRILVSSPRSTRVGSNRHRHRAEGGARRPQARGAGAEIQFPEGSVTTLTTEGVGSGFRLILDFGVAHGLPPDDVRALGREVTAVADGDATLLMYAFSPGRRGSLPRGIDRAEIAQAYSGWAIAEEEAFDLTGAPRFVQSARPRFCCLRRRRS
jgi:hypothetical protein